MDIEAEFLRIAEELRKDPLFDAALEKRYESSGVPTTEGGKTESNPEPSTRETDEGSLPSTGMT